MAEDDSDRTNAGAGRPPALPRAGAKTPPSDQTQLGGAPPPIGAPKEPGALFDKPRVSGSSPLESEPIAARAELVEAAQGTDDGEETVIEATIIERRSPYSLRHIEPPGHDEVIALQATTYTLGRSRGCEIQLYSASAHRQHGRIWQRDGRWWIEALEGKTVLADGDAVRGEVGLTHKVRLRLGDDELVFYDESAAPPEPSESAAAAPRNIRVVALVSAAVVLLLVLLWIGWR